jgi:hypothetical protein
MSIKEGPILKSVIISTDLEDGVTLLNPSSHWTVTYNGVTLGYETLAKAREAADYAATNPNAWVMKDSPWHN